MLNSSRCSTCAARAKCSVYLNGKLMFTWLCVIASHVFVHMCEEVLYLMNNVSSVQTRAPTWQRLYRTTNDNVDPACVLSFTLAKHVPLVIFVVMRRDSSLSNICLSMVCHVLIASTKSRNVVVIDNWCSKLHEHLFYTLKWVIKERKWPYIKNVLHSLKNTW